MALQDKTEDEIRALEQQLLTQVLEFGGKAGNTRLMRTLGWPEEDYWAVRNRLVDAGAIRLYRARGGAVEVPPAAHASPETAVVPADQVEPVQVPANPPQEAERDLYEPVAAVLRGQWSLDFRFQHQLVEKMVPATKSGQIARTRSTRSAGGAASSCGSRARTWRRPTARSSPIGATG